MTSRTVTVRITADPDYGGQWYGSNAVYATARSTLIARDDTALLSSLGQLYPFSGTNYFVGRCPLKFNTNIIPENATINSAYLDYALASDISNTDFDIDIVKADWGAYVGTTNYDAIYDSILAGTKDITLRNTSGIATNTVYSSTDLDTTYISSSDYTYYGLRSSRDFAGTQPSTSEYVRIHTGNATTAAYRPTLVVTYTCDDQLDYGCYFMWGSTDYSAFNEADRLTRYTIDRGRSTVFSDGFTGYDIGTLRMEMDNYDGRYDVWDSGSAIYGSIKPGTKMQLTVDVGSTDYQRTVFTGHLEKVETNGYRNTAILTCQDGWRWLQDNDDEMLTSSFYSYAQLMDNVLYDPSTDAQYPWNAEVTTDSTLLAHSLSYEEASRKSVIEHIAAGSLGRAWIDVDGNLNFGSIGDNDSAVRIISEEVVLKGIDVPSPWDSYRSKVKLNTYMVTGERTTDVYDIVASWSDTDNPIVLTAVGSSNPTTSVELIPTTFIGDYYFSLPGTNNFVTSPTTNSGDFLIYNTYTNFGTDNFNITITSQSTSVGATFDNIDCYWYQYVYSTTSESTTDEYIYETTDSTMRDAEFVADSIFLNTFCTTAGMTTTDYTQFDDYGNTLINYLSVLRPYPILQFQGRYDLQFDLDLEDKVTLNYDHLEISGDYRISKISHESKASTQDIVTTLWLYPVMELST